MRKIVLAIIAVSLLILLFMTIGLASQKTLIEQEYSVQYGDCLWDIAGQFCPDGMDTWSYIHMISELNDLSDSCIQPYQKLIVLVEE